jgi:hypothetical protein
MWGPSCIAPQVFPSPSVTSLEKQNYANLSSRPECVGERKRADARSGGTLGWLCVLIFFPGL